MELNIWTEVMLQAGVVAGGVLLLTEFLAFGATKNQKRGMAILWSILLTFAAYLIDAIKLPEVVAAGFTVQTWPKFVVLLVIALLTAAEAMGAHSIGAAVLAKKKSTKPGLPE